MFRVLRWPFFIWTDGDAPPPFAFGDLTVLISAGPPTIIAQTTAYALPARPCRIQATAVLQISPDGTNGWVDLAGSTTGTDVGSGFVRCAGSTAVVILRSY